MLVPFRRPTVSLLLAALALAVAGPSRAADAPPVKTSPSKRAEMKEAAPHRDGPPGGLEQGRAAGAGPAAPGDPMDRLRARLAERLGPRIAPGPNPDVVQVAVSAPEGTAPPRRAAGTGTRRAPAAATASAPGWSYDGATGPDQWSRLRPEYAGCGRGLRQSPIDIRDAIGVVLDPIAFAYQASPFAVVDTGRTVRVDVAPGNAIEVMGRKYELQRVEFRRPAEERIGGRQFDMGAHLVHKDAEGRTAIVAVLLDRGADQPVIQSVWNNLPLEKGESLAARTGIDLSALLPSDRRYYTYMGSMTTPPCQEGVLWMVMKSPVAISGEQLAVFARLYPHNARPVQPASDRLIKGPQ